tara:strand:+ start:3526 stop:4686 length:1161 start_codon:yes stop_codon:yes gene_type:complete
LFKGEILKPIENITVLDFSSNLPGPYCSSILISLGARVIKVESPEGDPFRKSGHMWTSLNIGKESISINLKTQAGKNLIYDLVRTADVIIEGWRPGVAKKLGVDYSILKGINNKLIYCSISGYGQEGPWAGRTGHDINYLASSGYYSIDDRNKDLAPPSILIADISSAFYACILILSFIAGRNTTGEGCYIDLAMAESVLSILNLEFAKHFSKSSIKGAPNVTYLPHYNIYKCSDDSWITLGIVDENHFWSGFCVATGLDDIKDWDLNKRTENYQFIAGRLNKLFLTKTSKEWEKLLVGINVPASTVNTIEEVIQNAQFQYRDVWSQYAGFQFAGMPALINNKNIKISGNAPSLGEHTNQIVKELNYTKEQIGKLNSEKTTPIPLE